MNPRETNPAVVMKYGGIYHNGRCRIKNPVSGIPDQASFQKEWNHG